MVVRCVCTSQIIINDVLCIYFSLVFSFHVFLLQMFTSSYPALILNYLILTNAMNFILCLYLSPLSLPFMGDETGLQVFIASLLYFCPWFLHTIVEFGALPCLISCVCAVVFFFVPSLWDAGSYSPFFMYFLLNFYFYFLSPSYFIFPFFCSLISCGFLISAGSSIRLPSCVLCPFLHHQIPSTVRKLIPFIFSRSLPHF